MTKDEAIRIAQAYIDARPNIHAEVTGNCQEMDEWVLDAHLYQVHHPVWVVNADNLKPARFEGCSTYCIVVSTQTGDVEDVRMV